MYKNTRLLELIKLLSKNEEPVNSASICKILKIKPRTLRKELSGLKEELNENGIEIVSRHGAGYILNIVDENKYYDYVRELLCAENADQCLIPELPEERITYIIRRLLETKEYQKSDDIADSMYISRSTMNNDLKEVKSRLNYFHLDLVSKPSHGIKIMGSELHIRSCIAKYFFHTNTLDQSFMEHEIKDETQNKIRKTLYETLRQNKIKLTDIGFQNLIVHIYIAILRNKSSVLQDVLMPEKFKQLESKQEFQIAINLVGRLHEIFSIRLPDIEVYYLTIHLMCKRTFDYNGKNENFFITEETKKLFDCIYSRIKEDFSIDFSMDFELYALLALHFQPMMERLKYRIVIENPVLEQIKENSILAFNMAVSAGSTITELTGLDVNENELGYMAVHFALAHERKKQSVNKKNIIILCASGVGSSQILLYTIKRKFGPQLDKVYVTSLYELEMINQREYDFILSTVEVPFDTDIPVIQVQYYLEDRDYSLINEALAKEAYEMGAASAYFRDELVFTNLEGKSRNELIKEMCEKIKAVLPLPEEFEGLIFQRESVSATEFGNNVAFPHPIRPITDSTFVAIGVLPKPVRWDRQYVKYIFLLSVKKDVGASSEGLYEALVDLFYNQKLLNEFGNKPEASTITEFISGKMTDGALSEDIFK